MKKGAINIREVDKSLIQRLKSEAALKGLTLRKYIINVLAEAAPVHREPWQHDRGGEADPAKAEQ